MTTRKITNSSQGIHGTISVPGDKSISHRALMFGAIAHGETVIHGFLKSEDCINTMKCLQQLHVKIEEKDDVVIVYGKGFEGLEKPERTLYVGNSGTTIRLLLGILGTLPFETVITGDDSIKKRPMDRVVKPLSKTGALFSANKAPIVVSGTNTKGITYDSPIASAQVKSSILLAALNSVGTTNVSEPKPSRDHTERMLSHFNVSYQKKENMISLIGKQKLTGREINVPGDISSAAFFIAAAIITPNSSLEIHNVGLNETRTGIIDILLKMGANITISNHSKMNGEEVGTIHAEYSPNLNSVEICGETIPRLIDEIPILALVATQANGMTVIKDASELKVKETNRITAVADELTKCGAKIEPTNDGMTIVGKSTLQHANVTSHGDHRIGMMLAIAGLIADGGMTIEDAEAVSVSYPHFFEELNNIMA
ncbi:3-phosphoshikimate 1-carboxyvinyltransferase [Lottiidibacillus patelloidae]|uniref:3-phosphoshikimate 1-carboxyvinyltransferase n=1 Tax=Lottiidibacillus patelloidae TaxID=2670334 RepID=A0A263BU81_9BACI|nr:3-phosphoshikimate 1-carboxyvinyltransferase [Lottiidibacillus patelloidae]OZM57279.1 3-phosphoshikimate 1-carboxyvinyltransferase [Lottiidibacillus patelloidae]